MSYRELSMIEVKEVLRRREAGQALREIARETGCWGPRSFVIPRQAPPAVRPRWSA